MKKPNKKESKRIAIKVKHRKQIDYEKLSRALTRITDGLSDTEKADLVAKGEKPIQEATRKDKAA